MNQGYIIFGGVDSRTYSVYITGENAYNAPGKRSKTVEVPGRNGTLTLAGATSYDDIEVVYPAFIASNYATNVDWLRNALNAVNGKQRLVDSYHNDEYRLARYVDSFKAKTLPNAAAGSFDIAFECDPRRFLMSGDTAVTIVSGDTLTNPTLFSARPVFRVYGAGSMMVGGQVITVAASAYPYIDIDSEMMDCHYGVNNCNALVTLAGNDFPILPAGNTGITFSGITSIEVTPRWWRL